MSEMVKYAQYAKFLVIPNEIVPVNFEMNPETEDLIRGTKLTEGMVVLIEVITSRVNPQMHLEEIDHECDQYDCMRLLRESRWCKVTDLNRTRDLVSFIGVYADGTKRSRTYNESYCWYVKH